MNLWIHHVSILMASRRREHFNCGWCMRDVDDFRAIVYLSNVCQECLTRYINDRMTRYRVAPRDHILESNQSYVPPSHIADRCIRTRYAKWLAHGRRIIDSRPCRQVDCGGRIPTGNHTCDECGVRQQPNRRRKYVADVLGRTEYDQCPTCGEAAVKDGGCDAVTCAVCRVGYEFGYRSSDTPMERV